VTDKKQTLFTLLDDRNVCVAPGCKKLSAEAFSTLLECKDLLATVQQDAEAYRKGVAQECELLKEQAEREGFQSGYDKWLEVVSQLEAEIARVKGELQRVVMSVAMKAARKIVTTELTTRPEVISDIVSHTLKTVAQHKRIVVYVNKEEYPIVEAVKTELKDIFDELESLSIREREDVELGGCVIETERGIINARLKDRWRSLEAALKHLATTVHQGPEE